uniref:ATP-grasp domain-containing protein n=1 Tax=Methylocapsa acidiphila TaxID=133552 RepID=Q2VNP5_METAI|nr:conserved hypothetical protein [Methylocapsa acidiphila]
MLIAATSGRALAAAARRTGYRPLVADFFDDGDTRILSEANCAVAGDLGSGFEKAALIEALESLARGASPLGLVYGAGFEDRIEILEELARRWTIFGNAPEVVRRVKDPFELAALCRSLGVRHPEISLDMPHRPRNWLVKTIGGAGGSHVAPAGAQRAESENVYYQRVASGEPISFLFVADGADAQAIGASRQWTAPTGDEPFRFGGSLRPAECGPRLEARLAEIATAIARQCKLRGLNGIDFLVDGDEIVLIEINPRPGATLDIFEDREGSLFQAHIDGCLGRLPERPLEFEGAAAAAIAYARRPIPCMPTLDWPDWAADRQKPRSALNLDDPLCTVKAHAALPGDARKLIAERTAFILDNLEHIGNGAAS